MMKKKAYTLLLVAVLWFSGNALHAQNERQLTFPFSQLVVRNEWAAPIVWKYKPFTDIVETETVIAPPAANENWNAWYARMKTYQKYLRNHLNDTSSLYLEVNLKKNSPVKLFYKRVLNKMRLLPNDTLRFEGWARNVKGSSRFSVGLIYIKKGQELSHATVQSHMADSVVVGQTPGSLHIETVIPPFDTEKLVVQPFVYFSTADSGAVKTDVSGLTLSIPARPENTKVFNELRSSFYPKNKSVDKQLYQRPELAWVTKNFISGFAYLWDNDFWDAEKKQFMVQQYCNKMKREFGGFQSVLIWIGYPNIGIDDKNIWQTIDAIPGGINGLREIVAVFHRNNIKVYYPYMPWEIDTRRPGMEDDAHWAQMIKATDADGLFFDTWFDGDHFQKALDKRKRGVSIGTEHHPTLQNMQGYNAITTSWGQTLTPYNNNGISRAKWLIPQHLQWTIKRWETDRQNTLAYSWINGQGILVWENVFGHMNTWNAKDRQALRKMNAIYQHFGYLYTSDSWKPYLPSGNEDIHVSLWQNAQSRIWNIVADKADAQREYSLPVEQTGWTYFDLWTGEKLTVSDKKVTVPLDRFSCVLAVGNKPSTAVLQLLNDQKKETAALLPLIDKHAEFILADKATPAPELPEPSGELPRNLLTVKAGTYHVAAKQIVRESASYPNMGAKNNYENTVEKGLIVHRVSLQLPAFQILQRAVSNAQYAAFMAASKYRPSDTTNYLAHWHGAVCPDSLLNSPVVNVTLEDARAYAKWAGMRLPTEWEWQAAAETLGNQFVYNEVFEWNESERFDGHNHFVTLRGGCKNWRLQTSSWYFPGTFNESPPGGPQPPDFHSKYFIMKTGFDRAGTLGFRCVAASR